MITKEFLEKYPLYKKLPLERGYYQDEVDNIASPAINMFCHSCKSMQTFNMVNDYWENCADTTAEAKHVEVWGLTVRAVYTCSACNNDRYIFFIQFIRTGKSEKDENVYTGYAWKVGQTPRWEIDIDKSIEKALGEDAELYKKGLVLESQSYGIGSYAYFRRITENVIDELLDSIGSLIDEEEKENYKEALCKVKKTRITEEKIELVQDLLPASLQPDGMNPLKLLHSALSEGLHNKSDDGCMELADTIKTILVYLLEEIRSRNDKAKTFTDKMKKLLSQKKG